MANFLNDGSLIGFWPLNEPSGAPIFLNYSPARSRQPSGISFDFHVAQAESQAAAQVKSIWPGTTSVFNPESGVTYRGFMPQGYWKLSTDSSPYSRYLVLGNGCSQVCEQTLAPNVAQSGITAGIWVYPNSNGYLNFYADVNTAAYNVNTEGTRCHVLFNQKQFASLGGWQIGVSGSLNGGAQFNSVINNNQLTAYVSIERNGGTQTPITTPIESGCYTHLTFTFRYIDGTSDQIVLYKNGRVAASGTSNTAAGGASSTSLGNATLVTRALAIGGGDNANAGSNNYGGTCGWNHLVSGAYLFRRVLNEAEILDLHNGSTLQPLEGNRVQPVRVELTDPQLLAHYPFRSIGWPDVSKNHRPLIGPKDEGVSTHYIPIPGPFKGGSLLQNGTNQSDHFVTTSGLVYDMINGRSWTIGLFAGPVNGNGRSNNMILSMGSVSAATAGAPTAITTSTFGMALTEMSSPNRMRFSAHPLGDITSAVFNIDTSTSGYYNGVSHHYAIAYDDSTKGIAVYLDGSLQGSGTLAHSLSDQLLRLAGSGYPLVFTNGVQDGISNATTHGMLVAGGQKVIIGPITIMGRALLPQEIMYIAQSGIDTSATWRTPYDTRLMGYWPCSDFKLDDVIVEDRARPWEAFPGNLIRGDTTTKWSAFYNNVRINQFGTRTTPPELDSFGVLGITSGIFSPNGLSLGTENVSDAGASRSSIANLTERYKPVNEVNNAGCQNVIGDFILGFEVTPSGTIPSTPFGLTADNTKFEFNSTLTLYGNLGGGTSDGELRSFLTTVDAAQGSGVSLVFASRTGTFNAANFSTLVSGVLPFGVPTKVLFHSKFDAPYNLTADTAGTTPLTLTLWINGVIVQRRRMTAATARVWGAGTIDSTSDDMGLEFGGEAGNDSLTSISRDGGLGDIYMREIFLMRGTFDKDEVIALATSGIQLPTITGYTPTLSKTQVNISNTNLEGYWRFNGLAGGGSGTSDLSLKGHHLTPLSEQKNRAGASTQSSRSFRFLPGPLKNSDLLIQCSGLSYTASSAGAANITPPFAVSGAAFDSPQNGFSVGFFMAKRTTPSANTSEPVLTYGIAGSNSVTDTSLNFNRGWSILTEQGTDIKMVMSVGGNGYYANTSNGAQSGQIVCGTYEAAGIYGDLRRFNNYIFGNQRPARLDFWSHYCWTYDATNKELKCYVNGQEVDRKATKVAVDPLNGGPASGLNPIVPVDPASRLLTFFNPPNASPWDFSASQLSDIHSVITDVFYFSKTLSEPEIRYIAENGIDGANGTAMSGIVGGYIQGSIQSSGIIGGYQRGQDTISGIIGGFDLASLQASGIIGGYVSGVLFFTAAPSGSVGGYILASDRGSGLFGGYVRGADTVSGIIGGFVLGGLRNSTQFDGSFVVQAFAAKDFDSQIVLRKSTTSDFDAKLVVFQAEVGPVVDIIIPRSTVSGISAPFNQYFIGAASGTQGKTISQTRWTFGDLTSSISVAESGGMGLYPVQHHYAGSGFFIAKFEAIDSNGIHGSATRIINATSGIDPVIISLSGVPRSGSAALTVDFTMTVDILPPGVSITATLLNFDDGQSTISFNPTHVYTEPGVYKPIWIVRDSRGVIWGDSLESGNDFLKGI